MKLHIPAALLALSAMACQSDAATGGLHSQLRDSAGIRIVENARPPTDSRLSWRIDPEPSVSIGVLEGSEPHMLFNVSDAARLTDGRIVVVNRGTTELRVFDARGTYLDTWGGKGEGPGEFDDIFHIEPLPGDSVLVWALMEPDVAVFGPDGNFARSFPARRRLSDQPYDFILPMAATSDGWILAVQNQGFVTTDSVAVELWDMDGVFQFALGTYPAAERYRTEASNYPVTFGRRLAAETWRDMIVVSPTDHYEFRAFAKDGSLARIMRRDHLPIPPTGAHIEAYIEQQVSRLPEALVEVRESERKHFQSVPVAEHLPAFDTVMADARDHLWVKEYAVPGDPLWTVFDPEGRVLGFVETPRGLEIYEIGEDYILGRVASELGVESVQVWRLDRTSTSQSGSRQVDPNENRESRATGPTLTQARES